MKKFNKLISFISAVTILGSTLPVVSAMEVKQGEIINIFDSLQGYSKTKEVYVKNEALPKGMGILGQEWTGRNFQSIENADGTRCGGIINVADSIYVPFEETVAEGIIHYSMDMKFVPSEDGTGYLMMDYLMKISSGDWNPQNIWGSNQNPKRGVAFRVNKEDTSDAYKPGALITSEQVADEWHSIDVYIDVDSKKVKSYLDGTFLTEEDMLGSGIKALRFLCNAPSGGNAPSVYMDNIYIRHYKKDSSDVKDGYESIKMALDFAPQGVALKDGMVRLAYSEPISVSDSGFEPWSDDIKITRLSDGEVLTPDEDYTFEFTKREGGVISFLTELEEGEYEVAQGDYVDAEAYGGLISGRAVLSGESARFYTEKYNVNLADEYRFLINEDFNSYNGGTHANSVAMVNDWGKTPDAVVGTHTDADDKAIKLSLDDSAAVFKFNKPVQGGKFVVEFDVKHTNGGWGVNLLKERDFLPANYLGKTHWEIKRDDKGNAVVGSSGWLTAQNDYYQEKLAEAKAVDPNLNEATWRNENWPALWDAYRTNPQNVLKMRDVDIKTSFLVGNHEDAEAVKYSDARANTGYQGNKSTGNNAVKNEWTHVSVEVDTTSGVYTIKVGDNAPVVGKTNGSNFATGLQRYTNSGNSLGGSYNIETRRQNWTFGFGGIALRTFKSDAENASVEFDNLKVYTNAYNDYETFDKVSGMENFKIPGWYNILGEGPATDPGAGEYRTNGNYYYVSEGKNYNAEKNPTDKAFTYVVSSAGSGMIAHQLSVPVKAGNDFEMEFDLKIDNTKFNGSNTGDGKDTAFTFHMVTAGRLYNPQYQDSFNLNNKTYPDNDANKMTEVESRTGAGPDWSRTYTKNLLFANSAIEDGKALEDAGNFRFYTGRQDRTITASYNGTLAYSEKDGSTNLALTSKQWNNIKLSGRAVDGKYAVKITVNGVTSQEYLTEIPSNQDIVAVAFEPLRSSTASRRAIHLDNFKVSEPGFVKNGVASVNKVTGLNEVADFADEFKLSDDSVNMNFLYAVSETDIDNMGVWNVTKNSEVSVTKTLSSDKRTVNVKFNNLPDVGDKLKIYVNRTTEMTGNDTYLNALVPNLEAYEKTFNVVAGNGTFEVENIRLFSYYPEWIHPDHSNVISPEGWHPVMTENLDLVSLTDDAFKVVIKGYNGTGEEKTIKLINGAYSEGRLLNVSNIESKTIGCGLFEIEFAPIDLGGAEDNVKAFVLADDLITPVGANIDYDITFVTE